MTRAFRWFQRRLSPLLSSGKGTVGLVVIALLVTLSWVWSAFGPFDLPGNLCRPDWELPRTETTCSRTLVGLQRSMGIGLISGGASSLIALILALAALQFGRLSDLILTKVADIFFALPDILVLLLIFFMVGLVRDTHPSYVPSQFVVTVFALTIVSWAGPTRMVRNRLKSLLNEEFVQAAEVIGSRRWYILTRHLLPFAWDYLMAIFLLRVPATMLAESAVSFLGFGGQPNEASLGGYIGGSYNTLLRGEWQIVPALILLALIVIAFQWIGEAALARAGARKS